MTRSEETGTFVTARMVARGEDTRLKVDLIAFGTEAHDLAMTAVGDQLLVFGDARIKEWKASDGTPRLGMMVTVWRLIVLGEDPSEEDEGQGVMPL